VVKRGSTEWPIVPPDARFAAPPRATPRRISRYVEYVANTAGWSVDPANPAAVTALVAAYAGACAAAGLDPLVVICQLLVETDGLRSPSPWLRVDPHVLDGTPAPPPPGFHTSWHDAAQFHAQLLFDEAARGAMTVTQVAHERGGQRYLERLLGYTDSILMPQY
jgi:hypothetical protein